MLAPKTPLTRKEQFFPIFKKGDESKIENYRPVSLTSLVCKTLQSIYNDTIEQLLDENDAIRDTQHGFRKYRSCLTDLL